MGHSLTSHTKINPKCIKDLNVGIETINLLKHTHTHTHTRSKLLRHQPGQYFSGSVSQGKGNKSKNKQLGQWQTKKVMHSKGDHQQNEKATY